MEELLAAIDFGTTGVRAEVFLPDGGIACSYALPVSLVQAVNGTAEQSIEEYWNVFLALWEKIKQDPRVKLDAIAAIGFSHQRCTFALVDEHGSPLTPLIVWMDKRGIRYLPEIESGINKKDYYNVIGLPIYYISSISKLLWLRDNLDGFAKTYKIWPITNFILQKLGIKDPPVDHATASFYGFLDSRYRKWDLDIIKELKLKPKIFPELVQPGTIIGRVVDQDAVSRLGIRSGTPLVIGGGDQQCAALGSGMISPGKSLINLGTATALMTSVDKPVRDPNHIIPCVCHAAPGKWEMEGHTQASGVILNKFLEEFGQIELANEKITGQSPFDILSQQAEQAPPGSDGLVFLPVFNGSTVPVDYPYGMGMMLGIRQAHSRNHFIRSIFEGICFENRWIIENIQKSGVEIDDVLFAGGGSKSAFWSQLHADILNRNIINVSSKNASLIGAAICAGIGIGMFETDEDGVRAFTHIGEFYAPNLQDNSIYNEVFSIFVRTYEVLRNNRIFENVYDLQKIGV